MKGFSYAWCCIKNFITMLIYLAILSAATTTFQTIVISGLALIYMSIGSSLALISMSGIEQELGAFKRFSHLAKLLKDPEISGYEETLEEELDKVKAVKVKFYIGIGFTTIIFVVAVYKILTAVL